ncbi:MAG: adenylate/guanylate cyclase domain-containing protein [Planctomycetes bacterium]|nr:adenylate/guanylate cyclase domain-containing protein [Planctomycetota bacterium]
MTTKRVQRNLTIMFTDISGFTKHTERISRDQLMNRLDTHNKLLMPIVAHFEGNIIKTIGDSFMITFESPTNAVECGTFMQHTLRLFNADKPEPEQIHIKVSINAGEVTVSDNDVFGDAVNVAAKIEKVTAPDEIYFTEAVFLSMNKAEVPNTFVKTFRPKGAESQEIKLYKVVQDENEPMYKRIVAETHIDTAKMKTRVLELSQLAEKEYARYQDALETLVTQHGKSSRTGLYATVAAALIIGVAILVGFLMTRQDPAKQLETDVRAFLVSDKPKDARTVVDNYARQHGENDAAKGMRAEIRSFELNAVEKEASALLAQGKPEIAQARIKEVLGDGTPTPGLEKVLKQARGYSEARALLDKGDYLAAKNRLDATFGEESPGDHVKLLRDQANALEDTGKMLQGKDPEERAAQAIGLLTKVFGDQSQNPAFVDMLHRSLMMDLGRRAKTESARKVRAELEDMKKRFVRVTDWAAIEREIDLGGLWMVLIDNQTAKGWRYYDGVAWETQQRLTKEAADRKDPEFLWRIGETLFQLDKGLYLRRLLGVWQWHLAIKLDPGIPTRKAEFKDRMEFFLGTGQDAWAEDEENAEKRDYWPVRVWIKKYCFKELHDRLIKGLQAVTNDGKPWMDERVNCYCILADMGEADQLKDRLDFFKDVLKTLFERNEIFASHLKPMLALNMTYEEYLEYRKIMDNARDDSEFAAYGYRHEVLDQLVKDIKEVQVAHTARYGK